MARAPTLAQRAHRDVGAAVVIEGADELLKQFRALGERTVIVLKDAAERGASIVKADAVARAPKRMGRLARGIKVFPTRAADRRRSVATEAESLRVIERLTRIGAMTPENFAAATGRSAPVAPAQAKVSVDIGVHQRDAFYAPFVELGHDIVRGGRKRGRGRVTGHVRERPFLRPAIDGNTERIAGAIGQVIAAELDRIARG